MNAVIESDTTSLTRQDDGTIRIGSSRVTLDTVVSAFRDGASAESIVDRYPTLSLADVYSTIAFSLRHPDTVDSYLSERDKVRATVRTENESRFPPGGIRSRLLARRTAG
jgi:uncharacterized protein (DUF433 family)